MTGAGGAEVSQDQIQFITFGKLRRLDWANDASVVSSGVGVLAGVSSPKKVPPTPPITHPTIQVEDLARRGLRTMMSSRRGLVVHTVC